MKVRTLDDIGYTQWRHILNGCILMVIAVLFIVFNATAARVVFRLGMEIFLGLSLLDVITYAFRPKLRKKHPFFGVVIKAMFMIVLSIGTWFETLTIAVAVILMALYQLFLCVVNAVTYWIYKKDNTPKRARYLRGAIFYGLLAIPAIFAPIFNSDDQFLVLGIYLFSLGCTSLRDGLLFYQSAKKTLKRRVRVSLPIVMVALLPAGVLSRINQYLEGDQSFDVEKHYNQTKQPDEEAELEVLVHTSDKKGLFGAMGHVDLVYKGTVYAFGNYDILSERLFGSVGDGILFSVNKDDYIQMCQKEDSKTLFSYGLKLSSQQQQAVDSELNRLIALTVPFTPSNEPLVEKNGEKVAMYLSRLQTQLGAKVYKFTQSKFKTYFVLSTNCVLLADTILGSTGTDVLSVKGFIAPGTYQEYLDREYARPHSHVISRKVYYSFSKKE